MSLVSTYVRADDGLFYNDPTLSREGWFICFDDEEPPELVVAEDSEVNFKDVFKMLGIDYKGVKERRMGGERMFDGRFRRALSYFFELKEPIPTKYITESDGTIESPEEVGQGVFYDPKEIIL